MKLAVVVLEDEAPVRDALLRDLDAVATTARVEVAEDADDARAVLEELTADGDRLAVLLADHRLPGTSGVDLLIALQADPRFAPARMVLVTGQADQQDTIRAVNQAGLDHYIAKPWDRDELLAVVREQLTGYVLDTGLDPLPHLPVLDAARVLPVIGRRGDR